MITRARPIAAKTINMPRAVSEAFSQKKYHCSWAQRVCKVYNETINPLVLMGARRAEASLKKHYQTTDPVKRMIEHRDTIIKDIESGTKKIESGGSGKNPTEVFSEEFVKESAEHFSKIHASHFTVEGDFLREYAKGKAAAFGRFSVQIPILIGGALIAKWIDSHLEKRSREVDFLRSIQDKMDKEFSTGLKLSNDIDKFQHRVAGSGYRFTPEDFERARNLRESVEYQIEIYEAILNDLISTQRTLGKLQNADQYDIKEKKLEMLKERLTLEKDLVDAIVHSGSKNYNKALDKLNAILNSDFVKRVLNKLDGILNNEVVKKLLEKPNAILDGGVVSVGRALETPNTILDSYSVSDADSSFISNDWLLKGNVYRQLAKVQSSDTEKIKCKKDGRDAFEMAVKRCSTNTYAICNIALSIGADSEKPNLAMTIEQHEKVIALNPSYLSAEISYSNVADAYLKHGHLEKAKEFIEIAYMINPTKPSVVITYAEILHAQQKFNEAKKMLKGVDRAKINDSSIVAKDHDKIKAKLYLKCESLNDLERCENLEEAERLIKTVYMIDSKSDTTVVTTYAEILYAQKKYAEADKMLKNIDRAKINDTSDVAKDYDEIKAKIDKSISADNKRVIIEQ